jgi:phage recombination protein Bet
MGNEVEGALMEHQGKEVVGVPAMTFTRDQIELVKRTVAKEATDDELALFLHTCKRTGLDPLAKQIHFVKRNTKRGPVAAFQTAIDGYRLVADRTGKYAGNDDPAFGEEKDGHPVSATVTVYKVVNGERCPFTATARWSEYFPGEDQGFMWRKMPYLMLGKCAEGLALRKAFPAELGGVYTDEEMQQADNDGGKPAPPASPKPKAKTDGGTLTFIPAEVEKKMCKDNKPKWGVKSSTGEWFGTRDQALGELAEEAKIENYSITMTYKIDGQYKNVVTLEKAAL